MYLLCWWIDAAVSSRPLPSGIPLAAGDTSWGLQRTANGLVAVCDEIHDNEGGASGDQAEPKHVNHDHGTGAWGNA